MHPFSQRSNAVGVAGESGHTPPGSTTTTKPLCHKLLRQELYTHQTWRSTFCTVRFHRHHKPL